jgi:ATP-dependent Lon protease
MDENQLAADIAKLRTQVEKADLPPDLLSKIGEMLERLTRQAKYGGYTTEFEATKHYLDWVLAVPWNTKTQDNLDLHHVRQVLDRHHYGLEDLKERMLEYLSVLILNEQKRESYHAPILLLVGLVGTGKTTLAMSLAEAMNRKFVRIPFGGMSSALDLRGQSRVHPEAEPGQIIKSLRRAGSRNPVILLDEIDRIAPSAHGEIMGVLVELLDPGQNASFIDHYIDFPFDLSQALFVTTANNTTNISTAVMDRLEPIMMPSYTDEEKIHIAKDYVFPSEILSAGLPPGSLVIEESVWPKIVRPLGFDAGIRTLERTIQGVVRKVAKKLVLKEGEKFVISEENVKMFLPSY